MHTTMVGRLSWPVFLVLSLMGAEGCGDGDQTGPSAVECSDMDCESTHRSCIDAVGTKDAFCGACLMGYFDKGGTCTTWTTCAATEFEATPGTATSDRECAALTECDASKDQIALPTENGSTGETPTGDRVCCHLTKDALLVDSNSGWPSFTEACLYVENNVEITGAALTDDRLAVVTGKLKIQGYEANNLQALKNLRSVGDSLYVLETDNLLNLEGLESLRSIEDGLVVSETNSLRNFEGLENLGSLGGGLNVQMTDNLLNFKGLEGLQALGGTVYLEYNKALVNFEGLNNIQSIGDSVFIFENASLVNFEGLERLETIGGNFTVEYNNKLTSLAGLQNLTTVENVLAIDLHAMLCKDLVDDLADQLGKSTYSNTHNNGVCD